MVDKIPELPSGNEKENKPIDDSPLLPSAEAYQTQSQDIENLIKELKLSIRKDLQDELDRLQYLLTEKEKELYLKEQQLIQKEAELKLLQAQLTNIQQVQAGMRAEIGEQRIKNVPDFDEELGPLSEEEQELVKQVRQAPHNPLGVGGLPGSRQSSSININRYAYEGDVKRLDDGTELVWGGDSEGYQFTEGKGNPFTFFAVEAAYLDEKGGYENPTYPQFYSQTVLHKQVWYKFTPRNRVSDGIGEAYQGRVPQKILRDLLNGSVNSRRALSDGNYIEGVDFSVAYLNWRYKYQTGTFYKSPYPDPHGKFPQYAVLDYTEENSKGNAPMFRTDGNPRSATFGQQKKTSAAERARWATGSKSDKKYKPGSGRKPK